VSTLVATPVVLVSGVHSWVSGPAEVASPA
jgi:hypothetical protein